MAVSRVSNATAANAVAGLHILTPSSATVGSGTGSVSGQGSVTFSGASSVSLNGVLTNTYDTYRVVFNITNKSVSGSNLNFRARINGSDHTSSTHYYGSIGALYNATAYYGLSGGAASSWGILSTGSPKGELTIYSRASSVFNLSGVLTDNSNYTGFIYGGSLNDTFSAPADGFTFFVSSGTISGTIRVYGYNNG
jgi:hypothetical protein